MNRLLLTIIMLMLVTSSAMACAPAPSCWIAAGPDYLRSVCLGYAKNGQTLSQIAKYIEEPQKIAAFGKACKRLGVNLK
jgi:hypothetical protein